jgi:hypothetical protein
MCTNHVLAFVVAVTTCVFLFACNENGNKPVAGEAVTKLPEKGGVTADGERYGVSYFPLGMENLIYLGNGWWDYDFKGIHFVQYRMNMLTAIPPKMDKPQIIVQIPSLPVQSQPQPQVTETETKPREDYSAMQVEAMQLQISSLKKLVEELNAKQQEGSSGSSRDDWDFSPRK